jgi:hypothetical protein
MGLENSQLQTLSGNDTKVSCGCCFLLMYVVMRSNMCEKLHALEVVCLNTV